MKSSEGLGGPPAHGESPLIHPETQPEAAPTPRGTRVYLNEVSSGKALSPWHDIPLKAGLGLYNMVCEIPEGTTAKMEAATDEVKTPIKQDTKRGRPRCYPYGIKWNYGLLPQTWEDPSHVNKDVGGAAGDNDPVDVVDVSDKAAATGEVYPVKPLAALALIDEGELDWKIVAIRADDPKADLVNDIQDVEDMFPGTLTSIQEWFRDYKVPDGKPPNDFGLGGRPANKDYAVRLIEESHELWGRLVRRAAPSGELSLV